MAQAWPSTGIVAWPSISSPDWGGVTPLLITHNTSAASAGLEASTVRPVLVRAECTLTGLWGGAEGEKPGGSLTCRSLRVLGVALALRQ